MNADEIRNMNCIAQQHCLETKTVAGHEAGLSSLKISVLTEIAAQLAELNESRKPRWVWCERNCYQFRIDATQVVSLEEMNDKQTTLYMRGMDDPWTIDLSIEEAAAKLGIPLEK